MGTLDCSLGNSYEAHHLSLTQPAFPGSIPISMTRIAIGCQKSACEDLLASFITNWYLGLDYKPPIELHRMGSWWTCWSLLTATCSDLQHYDLILLRNTHHHTAFLECQSSHGIVFPTRNLPWVGGTSDIDTRSNRVDVVINKCRICSRDCMRKTCVTRFACFLLTPAFA